MSTRDIRPGSEYGSWTVVEFSRTGMHHTKFWMCKCACGVTVEVNASSLAYGKSKSCGCAKLAEIRDGKKRCSVCDQWLPTAAFAKRPAHSTGLRPDCRECSAAKVRATKYGLTVERHKAMVAACGNRCEICGVDGASCRWGCLDVDHDHGTGAVRGLLCNNCNRALGHMRDAPELLERAAEYLRKRQP